MQKCCSSCTCVICWSHLAQARNGQLATGQVYVADAGYWLVRAGVPKHAIVIALGGRPTPDLASFAAALAALEPGTKAPLQYTTFEQRHRIVQRAGAH